MGSFLFWLILIISVCATAWWALRRSAQLREEAEQREAAALSVLIATPLASAVAPAPEVAASASAVLPAALIKEINAALAKAQAPSLSANAPLMPLVLAFYQYRGYERLDSKSSLSYLSAVLRHRQQPQRLYAVIELPSSEKLSGKRLAQLARELHQQHFDRAIVVTEAGFEFDALALAKTLHFRLYDRAAIRARVQELPVPLQQKLAPLAAASSAASA